MEVWKSIEEFEKYQISNLGNVRNSETGRMLKSKKRGNQLYRAIDLYKNNVAKTYNIHRLVAQTFIPNPNNLPVVNHLDGDKTNNVVDNLEWCSIKENRYHAFNELYTKTLLIINKETGEVLQEIDLENCIYKTVYIKK